MFGHPSQVRMQVLVSQTCADVRVRLAVALHFSFNALMYFISNSVDFFIIYASQFFFLHAHAVLHYNFK